jgi:hypothetical protein
LKSDASIPPSMRNSLKSKAEDRIQAFDFT